MRVLDSGRLSTFSSDPADGDSGANFLPIGGWKGQAAGKGAQLRCLWFGQYQPAESFPYAPNILHQAGAWRDVVPLGSDPKLLLLIGIKFEDWALDEYIGRPWWAWAVTVPLLGSLFASVLDAWRREARFTHRKKVRALVRSKPRHITVG